MPKNPAARTVARVILKEVEGFIGVLLGLALGLVRSLTFELGGKNRGIELFGFYCHIT